VTLSGIENNLLRPTATSGVLYQLCFTEYCTELCYCESFKTYIWDVMPCSIVSIYHCIRGNYMLYIHARMVKVESAHSSETLVNFYQTIRHQIPEDTVFK